MRGKNLVKISVALLLAISTLAILPAKAQATRLYVDPPSIVDPTPAHEPGALFNVSINVEYVEDLYTLSFILSWDPALLNVTNVFSGGFLEEYAGPEGTFLVDHRYQEAGYIDEALTLLGPYSGAFGSGTVLIVEFLIEEIGTTPLALSSTVLLDSTPSSQGGPFPIDHTTTDGYFDNRGGYISPADLAGRSAWPDRHHFVIAKVGTTQTLWAKVRNLGTKIAAVKVVFTYTFDGGGSMVETAEEYLAVGEIRPISTTLTVAPGKYQVTAQCWYRFYSTIFGYGVGPWTPSDTKSFSFAVV